MSPTLSKLSGLSPSARGRRAGVFSLVTRLAVVVLTAAGCRGSVVALGATPDIARANADQLFGSLALRFTNVQRDERFETARDKLARHALAPSKLFGDGSLWTGTGPDSARLLTLAGSFSGDRYLLAAQPMVQPPERIADSRHLIRLRRIGEGEFEWATTVDNAIGSIGAADVSNALTATFAAAEGRQERELRADYRGSFPRAARALGQLMSIDTLRTIRLGDGSTALTLGIALHPRMLRATYPSYAKYVEKYVQRGKARVTLLDGRGGEWLTLDARDNFVRVEMRTLGGKLAPLAGPARPLPEELQLRFDVFEKFFLFEVGATNLVADFSFVRDDHDRGWVLRFRREPEWHLPLAVAHLIRTPLRRPFEQGGIVFRLGVRDSGGTGGQTILYRDLRFSVRESAIVRWLGGLGFTAMNDFAGQVEAEENRFNAEVFSAIRADVDALLTSVGR